VLPFAVVFVIAGGVGALASYLSLELLDHEPATVIKAAFNADDVTYRDGSIQIFLDVNKLRECPTTTSRWIWTWVDYKGEEVPLYKSLGGGNLSEIDVGEQRFIRSIPVPRGVWDGTWYYLERYVAHCGGILSLFHNRDSEINGIPIIIKGRQEQPTRNVQPAKGPPKRPQVSDERKAIINGGKPLP
jgi:hypothetical protein